MRILYTGLTLVAVTTIITISAVHIYSAVRSPYCVNRNGVTGLLSVSYLGKNRFEALSKHSDELFSGQNKNSSSGDWHRLSEFRMFNPGLAYVENEHCDQSRF